MTVDSMQRPHPIMLAGLVVSLVAIGIWRVSSGEPAVQPADPVPTLAAPAHHPVIIRKPVGPPTVDTGTTDHQGKPVTIACGTCHTTRTPNPDHRRTADLDLFHQGLWFEHGPKLADGSLSPDSPLSCLSCHNPGDYSALRLANGNRVEFTEVMQLCAQCHGPQYRDYRHGAHGGMNGSWDLTTGGRTRNGCTSCHDPHAPKYRGAIPVLPPADRFIDSSSTTSRDEHHAP